MADFFFTSIGVELELIALPKLGENHPRVMLWCLPVGQSWRRQWRTLVGKSRLALHAAFALILRLHANTNCPGSVQW